MKLLHGICRKMTLIFYLFTLWQLCDLCGYGGIRRHLPLLAVGAIGLLLSLLLWFISGNGGR